MRYILLSLLFLGAQPAIASDDNQTITADEGVVITVKKLGSARYLPHAFYDQAVSSIPKLYPEHEYLARRRNGRFGKVLYSVVCYKQSRHTHKVSISGTAVLADDAWSFETHVPESSFGDKLLIVLEAIEKLPSNEALRPTNGNMNERTRGMTNDE